MPMARSSWPTAESGLPRPSVSFGRRGLEWTRWSVVTNRRLMPMTVTLLIYWQGLHRRVRGVGDSGRLVLQSGSDRPPPTQLLHPTGGGSSLPLSLPTGRKWRHQSGQVSPGGAGQTAAVRRRPSEGTFKAVAVVTLLRFEHC